MFEARNCITRAHIQPDGAKQCLLGGAIHLFMRRKPVNAMGDPGGANRRKRKPGILVRAGCDQPIGAGHQLGARNSVIAYNSHAQSMAEPRIKGQRQRRLRLEAGYIAFRYPCLKARWSSQRCLIYW